MRTTRLLFLAAVLLTGSPLRAQSVSGLPGTEAVPKEAEATPRFAVYHNPETGTFVKPIVGFAGGFHYELQNNGTINPDLEPIRTTVALVLFGFEGRIGNMISFHTEFRRDPGFYGTSVWEGDVSLSSLDNWVRLERWGASLAAGIVTDPASVDFFSAHVTDMFMADAYSRTTLLHSGYNRGQGVLGQYRWNGFTAGLFYSAGNPLASSLSYGFGGKVSQLGTLIEYPRRSITAGNPQAGMELEILAPSLMYDSKWFQARANVQLYGVNLNTEKTNDVRLRGELYRGSVRGMMLGGMLQPFFNFAMRRNDMILQEAAGPNQEQYSPDDYNATVVSGGIDFNYSGLSGVGASYGTVFSKSGTQPEVQHQFINVGTTYWVTPSAAITARYAKIITATDNDPDDGIKDKDSLFLVMRLMI